MKNRNVILTLTLLAAFFTANQSYSQITVQGGVLAPAGDWADIWGMGFGAQASYKIERTDKISIGGSIGYFRIPGDEFAGFDWGDFNMIPILGTFDYKLDDMFYVGGDAGYNILSYDDDGDIDTAAGSSFALIPKVGAKYNQLSAEARYNIAGDAYFSFLIGYSF